MNETATTTMCLKHAVQRTDSLLINGCRTEYLSCLYNSSLYNIALFFLFTPRFKVLNTNAVHLTISGYHFIVLNVIQYYNNTKTKAALRLNEIFWDASSDTNCGSLLFTVHELYILRSFIIFFYLLLSQSFFIRFGWVTNDCLEQREIVITKRWRDSHVCPRNSEYTLKRRRR